MVAISWGLCEGNKECIALSAVSSIKVVLLLALCLKKLRLRNHSSSLCGSFNQMM